MTSTATFTSPCTLTEFQSATDPSTNGTGLRRRRPAVNLHHVDAVPLSLVRQLSDELAESRVTDRLREGMIVHHAAHVQVLDEYRTHLAIVRQFMRDLVQEVAARVPDLRMAFGNDVLLPCPVVRAFLFP